MIERRQSFLVLGGGGFLGTNLCRRLIASGFRVRAFGRRSLFPQELAGVEWREGDFEDRAALEANVKSFDIVFHLINGVAPQPPNMDTEVASTRILLDICRKLGQRIVFVSSAGTIYGRSKQIPTPETAPLEPITAYGISNLAIEKNLALYEHRYGLDFRVLRVTNAFGPFQIAHKRQGLLAVLICQALRNEPIEIWGDGLIVRDFIFVDDVLDALEVVARDQSSARIFNIGSGQGRTIREAIAAVETLVGKKLNIHWKAHRSTDVPISVVSIERAKNILGWVPKTSFKNGLEQTVSWWARLKSSTLAGENRHPGQ